MRFPINSRLSFQLRIPKQQAILAILATLPVAKADGRGFNSYA